MNKSSPNITTTNCNQCEYGCICKFRDATERYLKSVGKDPEMPSHMQRSIVCVMHKFGNPKKF